MSELFLEQSEQVLADWDAVKVGRYTGGSDMGRVSPDQMRWTAARSPGVSQACPGCGRATSGPEGCPAGPHVSEVTEMDWGDDRHMLAWQTRSFTREAEPSTVDDPIPHRPGIVAAIRRIHDRLRGRR